MILACRTIRLLTLTVVVAVAAGACTTGAGVSPAPATAAAPTATAASTAPPSSASTSTPSPSASADPNAAATIQVASTSLGDIVVDLEGRTLYVFTNDRQGAGTSVCNDACADAWPPLLVDAGATPSAGAGVTGELGTATRDDGTTQVTLNGWPLYRFAADTAAGDTNGQGVSDVWWVVSPAGEPIQGGSGPDEY